MWVYFALTVVSTLYFGWHYIADDMAGAFIAMVSVWLGGLATGQKFDRHGRGVAPDDVHRPRPGRRPGRGPGEDACAGLHRRPAGLTSPSGLSRE